MALRTISPSQLVAKVRIPASYVRRDMVEDNRRTAQAMARRGLWFMAEVVTSVLAEVGKNAPTEGHENE